MKFLKKMERRFGKYALHDLPVIVIALYAAGYIMSLISPGFLNYCRLDPEAIFHSGQVWRIITWIVVPPSSLDIFTIIMLFFYYSIAKVLAQTWGDFLFNVYIFSGILMTAVGACLLYAVLLLIGTNGAAYNIMAIPYYCSTYYINMSIFLAFALTYPDMQVLLYFLIPVKIKWLGWLYGAFLVYDFIRMQYWSGRVIIIVSLLNFILYFLLTRNLKHFSPGEIRRRASFRKATRASARHGNAGKVKGTGIMGRAVREKGPFHDGNQRAAYPRMDRNGARHRCTICGRTELDDPNLEFRYCSRCEGSYEYCQEHLFTHRHIKNGLPSADPQ